ncbi:MAG: hypothetical protein WD016_00680 [Balneolaceae bacterium]
MENEKRGRFKWQMLELPDGITTSSGNWYHITSEGIKNYLPGLLQKHSLEKIIREADAWLKSGDILSLMLYFILTLLAVNPYLAALVSIVFFVFWFFNTGAFVMVSLGPVIKVIQSDAFVYTVSGVVLIYFSFTGLEAMWVGAGMLFLFKVGLLRLGIKYVLAKQSNLKTQMPDRILNMLLIRYGLKEGVLTGSVKEMEEELLRVINYHRKNKK